MSALAVTSSCAPWGLEKTREDPRTSEAADRYCRTMAEVAVATDDGAVRVVVEGNGPAFVLCHGGPGLWDYFGPVRSALGDLVTVITWDQRGCGRSSGEGPYTTARHVEDLDAVRSVLDVQTWTVGGHSWGATLGPCTPWLPASQRRPRVRQRYRDGRGWNAHYHEESDRRRSPVPGPRMTSWPTATATRLKSTSTGPSIGAPISQSAAGLSSWPLRSTVPSHQPSGQPHPRRRGEILVGARAPAALRVPGQARVDRPRTRRSPASMGGYSLGGRRCLAPRQ